MWAEKYPQYAELESIGETLDGKELLLLSITDHSTGAHSSKPAFWCDGNTHAGEVTGTEWYAHCFMDPLLALSRRQSPPFYTGT